MLENGQNCRLEFSRQKLTFEIYLNVDLKLGLTNFRERKFAETFLESPRNSGAGNFKLDTG